MAVGLLINPYRLLLDGRYQIANHSIPPTSAATDAGSLRTRDRRRTLSAGSRRSRIRHLPPGCGSVSPWRHSVEARQTAQVRHPGKSGAPKHLRFRCQLPALSNRTDSQSPERRTCPYCLRIYARAAFGAESQCTSSTTIGGLDVCLHLPSHQLETVIYDVCHDAICGRRVVLAVRTVANDAPVGVNGRLVSNVSTQTMAVDFHIHSLPKSLLVFTADALESTDENWNSKSMGTRLSAATGQSEAWTLSASMAALELHTRALAYASLVRWEVFQRIKQRYPLRLPKLRLPYRELQRYAVL